MRAGLSPLRMEAAAGPLGPALEAALVLGTALEEPVFGDVAAEASGAAAVLSAERDVPVAVDRVALALSVSEGSSGVLEFRWR
jgi:hypothetical protein